MNLKVEQPRLLVVEGKDEVLFFRALLEHLGLAGVQVIPIGGKSKMREGLKALVRLPGFRQHVTHLGIVRDADDDSNAAFQSVRDSLRAAELPLPKSPGALSGGHPLVAVMILPGADTGALEDLCLAAVRPDSAMPCVESFFECLESRTTLPRHISKAKIQAFLASREPPGKRLGEAAMAGYWPWVSGAFVGVKGFLRLIAG